MGSIREARQAGKQLAAKLIMSISIRLVNLPHRGDELASGHGSEVE